MTQQCFSAFLSKRIDKRDYWRAWVEKDRIDVAYVAKLARLYLSPAEQAMFQGQLDQVVGYIRKIAELDLSGIEPTSHSHPVNNVFRKDLPRTGLDRDKILANAPEQFNGQFIVPKIVE
ncbi:MAG: Asp-tRNA(Asn)/Glu-tRNA(Gln) amidotransferase GatCAB subunit C [Verrucomicrobia bacterium]|nr:Asp-tRNA(Asn)/Glu-tRNA(Gln) amidotransferase GatCAB subunit C [Verrucomicrobiota bacterium]